MSYTSTNFILCVLAAVLVAGLLPIRGRVLWLSFLSLGWLASWHPYLPGVFLVFFLTQQYCLHRRLLWPLVLVSSLALVFVRLRFPQLSLGSSFYVLILLGLTMDVLHKRTAPLSLGEAFLLGSFFPLLMAGPVERAEHFRHSLQQGKLGWGAFCEGVLIFSLGFLKLHFLQSPLEDLGENYLKTSGALNLILGSLLSMAGLYVTLSSFADMGRGVARMFGIEVVSSFRPVIYSQDPVDFWERWNRTVASWFRDYLVFPSLLRWGRKCPGWFITFMAFLVLGLWHGVALRWLFFGAFNGVLVTLASYLRKKTRHPLPGRLLFLALFLGNGLLTFVGEVAPGSSPASGVSLPVTALLIFLAIEGLQEKFQDNDFFLRLPPLVKQLLAVFLFLLWIFLIDHRQPFTGTVLPLYFEL